MGSEADRVAAELDRQLAIKQGVQIVPVREHLRGRGHAIASAFAAYSEHNSPRERDWSRQHVDASLVEVVLPVHGCPRPDHPTCGEHTC